MAHITPIRRLDAHLKYGSASGRAEFGSLASDHITMEGWFLSLPIISFITSRWWARVVLSKFSALQQQADERKDCTPVGMYAAGHAVDTHINGICTQKSTPGGNTNEYPHN